MYMYSCMYIYRTYVECSLRFADSILFLKLSGFRLYIARDISGKSNPSSFIATPDVSVSRSSTGNIVSSGANPSVALSVLGREPPPGNAPMLQEKTADEGLILLKSPKVPIHHFVKYVHFF